MTLPSEHDLLVCAKKYDLLALGLIYDRFSPGIYRFALRLLGDDCQAEECVAETFSRFLQVIKIGKGPDDHLQAYLYRIAHNWITDFYRNHAPLTFPEDLDLPASDQDSVEAETEKRFEQKKVRNALRTLTPDQRLVITLHFLEGWSLDKIAYTMKKPTGAIRALQFRGMQSLKKCLRLDKE